MLWRTGNPPPKPWGSLARQSLKLFGEENSQLCTGWSGAVERFGEKLWQLHSDKYLSFNSTSIIACQEEKNCNERKISFWIFGALPRFSGVYIVRDVHDPIGFSILVGTASSIWGVGSDHTILLEA